MNRIGRLAIFAMLLIVALLIIWQVFGFVRMHPKARRDLARFGYG